jgi:DamX protein
MGYAYNDGKVMSSVPDYLDALQLSHDPFEAHPVDGGAFAAAEQVFYSGGQREKILDQVAHLTQFSSSVVVVAGELGSGRTTLKDMLYLQLEAHYRVADIAAEELNPPEQIFSQLAALLDCEVFSEASPGELMSAIRSELLQLQHERESTLLLLLDDAQLLSDAVLSALLSLLQAADPEEGLPFQVVMFGDMELIDRLDSFGMVDILLHDLVLPPLTEDEMADYLACRLEAAGWEGELPFTEAEVERLCGQAQGVPGAVHQAARELLIDKAAQELESGYSGDISSDHDDDRGERSADRHSERDHEASVSGGLPLAHIFSLVVLVGVLLMAFFYKDSWLGPDDELTERQTPLSGPVLNTADSEVSSGTVSRDSGARGGSRGTGTSISLPIGQDSLLTTESAAADKTSSAQPATRSETPSADYSPVAPPEAPSPVGSPASASTAPASSSESSVAEPVVSVSTPSSAAASSPAATTQPVATTKPVATTPATASSAISADERHLLGLSAEGYILQVMASSSQAAVETYLSRQANRQALRLYTTTRAGKPWFVVVTGNYSTVEMARAGIQSLPAEQKNAGPWPRKVADVQAQIKAFHGS